MRRHIALAVVLGMLLLTGCQPSLSADEYEACVERVEDEMSTENDATLEDYRARVSAECGAEPS